MKDVLIREMQRSELPRALALYEQPEVDNGASLALDLAEQVLDKIERYPFYRFYVAELNGKELVGIFGLLIMDNLGHQGARSGVVEGVCVEPALHGQGIGKQMMQKAVEVCRQQRCYKLSLSSNLSREKAHAFYNSLGFKQHGVSFHIDLAEGN